MSQTLIKQYFVASADARDTRTKQIRRLHDEALHSYKLRFLRYKLGEVSEPAQKRTYWYFMKLTLPSTHPLNPETFSKIVSGRSLPLADLRQLSFKVYEIYKENEFNKLSAVGVLEFIFSPEELAFAAAQTLG